MLSPAGRRADIVQEQVLSPDVYRIIRLRIQEHAPTVSKYVNAEGCLETGTAAGVFSLAASELFARVQRRQLTTVTILSEPSRLLNEGGYRERYISNARLLVRDGRAVFQQVDAIIYIEQDGAKRSKIDRVAGEFKALIYTGAADPSFGDVGNMRPVAGFSKVLMSIFVLAHRAVFGDTLCSQVIGVYVVGGLVQDVISSCRSFLSLPESLLSKEA